MLLVLESQFVRELHFVEGGICRRWSARSSSSQFVRELHFVEGGPLTPAMAIGRRSSQFVRELHFVEGGC